jgi:ubiquitin-protein ligase
MKRLELRICSLNGEQRTVDAPSNIRVSKLVEKLISSLPALDRVEGAAPISFHLSSLNQDPSLRLEPSKTLEQNYVKGGDHLLFWGAYPRQIQLRLERTRLGRLAQENDFFKFAARPDDSTGEPDNFSFQFSVPSIVGTTPNKEPIYSEFHEVSVYLHDNFPEESPLLRWDTPIWHPNIQHTQPKGVMISPWWSPGQGLDALAKLFLDMLQYKIYHATFDPPYPLDLEASRWVREYAEPNRIVDKSTGLLSSVIVLASPTPNSSNSPHIPTAKSKSEKIVLFISHSSKDAALVELLVDLLKSGLALNASEIRCTSVDGYRLPIGAKTDESLRKEIQQAKLFVGIISTRSLQSNYVLFELGARWGYGKHLAPLLASTTASDALFGPLANLNALRCDSVPQLHQLIRDLADELEITPSAPTEVEGHIERVVSHVKAQHLT